jgi:hypothetical protein
MWKVVKMNSSEFQSTYKCVVEDVELLRLALGLVIYFSGDLTSHRRALTVAVDAAWPLVESGIRSFQTTNMKRPKAIKDGKKILMQMLEEPPSPIYNYVSVDNRRHNNEAPDCCIEIAHASYNAGGYFQCRLPIGDDIHTAMLDIALRVATQWDFAHGYTGYTLACNQDSPKAILPKRMYYSIGMRHPGVDLPSADNTSFVIREGIKRVNWLTLLGTEMAQLVGSVNSLDQRSGVIVHRTGPGLIVQAGDAPLIGDTNRRETCEPYRRVGRALKGIRCKKHPAFVFGQGEFIASEEKTEAWLSSLDD